MAGPRKFDRDDLVPKICARLATGEPLEPILREMGLQKRTVNYWREHDEDIAKQFDEARDAGYDVIAASCLEIADDARNDYMAKLAEEGDEKAVLSFNAEHVQRSKLRIETRLKLLAKWDPRRYGDKLQQEITGKGGAALAIQVIERRIVKP